MTAARAGPDLVYAYKGYTPEWVGVWNVLNWRLLMLMDAWSGLPPGVLIVRPIRQASESHELMDRHSVVPR